MNEQLQNFAREQLKAGLVKLPDRSQHLFKQMYAKGNMELSLNSVIDFMDEDKLDWAMQQVRRTLDNAT